MTDQRLRFWEQMATEDVAASVIDINDKPGWKRKYIASIRDSEIKNRLLSLPNQAIILDFGCGCGDLSHLLSIAGFQVIGADISHGHLQNAAKKNQEKGINAGFVQTDGHRLPVLDNSVDACCTYLVLNYVQHDLAELLSEILRVLKPGGSCIAMEQVTRRPKTDGIKLQRPIGEFCTAFTEAGFEVLNHELVRRGHFLPIYLIRYRLIPIAFFPLFAACEKIIGRLFSTPCVDYADCVFHLRKPL